MTPPPFHTCHSLAHCNCDDDDDGFFFLLWIISSSVHSFFFFFKSPMYTLEIHYPLYIVRLRIFVVAMLIFCVRKSYAGRWDGIVVWYIYGFLCLQGDFMITPQLHTSNTQCTHGKESQHDHAYVAHYENNWKKHCKIGTDVVFFCRSSKCFQASSLVVLKSSAWLVVIWKFCLFFMVLKLKTMNAKKREKKANAHTQVSRIINMNHNVSLSSLSQVKKRNNQNIFQRTTHIVTLFPDGRACYFCNFYVFSLLWLEGTRCCDF